MQLPTFVLIKTPGYVPAMPNMPHPFAQIWPLAFMVSNTYIDLMMAIVERNTCAPGAIRTQQK
jgi:hypothetical protein